ncbi:DUF4333 domain-containing protein [Pseudonocardia saturnea]
MGTHGRTRRIAVTAGAMVAVGFGLAGCSTFAPADSVETQIVSQLGADTADCPTDLDSAVGASITCAATGGGETFDVAVTVTSVDGDTINFDIARVGAPAAPPASDSVEPAAMQADAGAVVGSDVAAAVSAQLTTLTGVTPDEISCPDLPAELGASIRCELVAGPDTLGLTVTTTSVQGDEVLFDFAVDETG